MKKRSASSSALTLARSTCAFCSDRRLALRLQEMRMRGKSVDSIASKLNVDVDEIQAHLDGSCFDASKESLRSTVADFRKRVDRMMKDVDKLRANFDEKPDGKTSYPYMNMMRVVKESIEALGKVKDPDTVAYEISLKILKPMVVGMATSILNSAKQLRDLLPHDKRQDVDDFIDRTATLLQSDVEWASLAIVDLLNGREVRQRTGGK